MAMYDEEDALNPSEASEEPIQGEKIQNPKAAGSNVRASHERAKNMGDKRSLSTGPDDDITPIGNGGAGNSNDEDETPRERLEELKKQLKLDEDAASIVNKSLKTHKDNLKELEGDLDEVDKLLATYEKALADIVHRKDDQVSYSKVKTPMIEKILGETLKNKIIQTIQTYDNQTQTLINTVSQRTTELETAKTNLEAAQNELDTKMETFNLLKLYQKGLETKLKSLDGFRQLIEREDVDDNARIMYFYMREFNNLLCGQGELCNEANPNVQTLDGFKTELATAWFDLCDAKENLRTKEKACEEKGSELVQAQNQLKSHVDNRVKELIKQINEIEEN